MDDASQKKILQYLTAALSLAVVGILVKEIFFSSRPPALEFLEITPPKVVIDFDLLKSNQLKELFSLEEISHPESVGRENPFLPF